MIDFIHDGFRYRSENISEKLSCEQICVTRGVDGVFCLDRKNNTNFIIPALTSQVVDRIGAGDSFLSLTSMSAAKGYPLLVSAFFGSIAAAIDVQIIGNNK